MTSPAEPVEPGARRWDVLVVGAGPAGLAAAAAAAEAGATVAVVDRSPRAGGQYWRHGAGPAPTHFTELHGRMRRAGAVLLPEHHVQTLCPDPDGWTLTTLRGADPMLAARPVRLTARQLVLATGAYDRQLPFPGWDLPGVLTAGGVQALLKEHGVRAGATVVVAGTGPFLLPVATGLLAAGARVPVVAEANSPGGFARHPRAVAGAPGKLAEGAGYLARLTRGGGRYRRRHAVRRALGTRVVEAVELVRLDRRGAPVPGSTRTVPCDTLAVGWGFTPQLELHLQAGCATRLDVDGSLVVEVRDDQRTSVAGVWAAGESTGIGGWQLAALEGEIAGGAAAGRRPAVRLLRRRAALRRFASAMHAVHPVPDALLAGVPDDVPACRCEEVPVGAVRAAVTELGATDARAAKLLSRAGMGWCQGRTCGYGTARLTAAACGRDVGEADLRAFAERPFAAPSRLGTLAGTDE